MLCSDSSLIGLLSQIISMKKARWVRRNPGNRCFTKFGYFMAVWVFARQWQVVDHCARVGFYVEIEK